MMMEIKHIALLMAMQDEAQGLIDDLGLQLDTQLLDNELPMRLYVGSYKGLQLSLLLSGKDERYGVDNIGTQAATLSAYAAIRDIKADVLISAGTAGGFADLPGNKGADIGRVYLSDEQLVFHDRRVPIPGFAESGVGHFPCLNVRNMAAALNLPYGVVSSGSSLEKSAKDVEVIERYGAVAKEMEAAAIAWVASLYKKPFFAIKSITNLLDRPGASEDLFLQNLHTASAELKKVSLSVLEYIQGKTLEDLAGE